MYKKHKRGFTLIELLVVIAIIGILASIVLVSFPGATRRAKDSRVISAIAQARTEMTSYNANQGTYVGFVVSTAIGTEVTNNSYGDTSLVVRNSADASCMFAPLNEKGGEGAGNATYYCADSTGIAGKTTTNPATADCNASNFACPSGTFL